MNIQHTQCGLVGPDCPKSRPVESTGPHQVCYMPFLPRPRLHVGCASTSWAATLSCLGLCALCKYDVIHKTGSTQSIAAPQEKDRATAMRNMQKKSGKCRVLLNISPYLKHIATLSCEILALSDSQQPMASSFCDTQYNLNIYCQLLLLHPFNDLFSRTTWVSRYQKGKPSLGLNEARDDGVWGWQWQLTFTIKLYRNLRNAVN